MKKQNRLNASHKRRQKGKGPARSRTQASIHQGSPGGQSVSLHATPGRAAQRDEADQKRQLWQRKQDELEARWVAAQSRQAEQYAARSRKTKRAWAVAGVCLAVLLSILVWYFAQADSPAIR